ncbi:elegans protein confirmed by transcript evidence [Moniliophthora roreri MCA 2997]|uniref:Elegans protein confirmed by transcript evidence n=1 Tax=Moniliophthora roreri (strain MCA 2997) TaxID=1381753 RepID=V2XDY8_MONRO|nr:elegans protein confirmed by transcript evidence [Moniliophthora roreri MCA 2997]
MQPSSTTSPLTNPNSSCPGGFLDLLYEDVAPFPNNQPEINSLQEPEEEAAETEEARRLRRGKWKATDSADKQGNNNGYLAFGGEGMSAGTSYDVSDDFIPDLTEETWHGFGSVASSSAIDHIPSQNDIDPSPFNNAAPPAPTLSPNQVFQHYVLPDVSSEDAQWTPLHFRILCYSINCIKQHRYLNPHTKLEWEQMLSAFMNEILRYLHTQVGKFYEPRRFDFTPLWNERLPIPVASLMDETIFVKVDDLDRPVLQCDPALASSTTDSHIFRYYLRRPDYEAVSAPRALSDLPTIRQVVPRQLPFTPINEPALDHHTSGSSIGEVPSTVRLATSYSGQTVNNPSVEGIYNDALHQQSFNWDLYLNNYGLNQQSSLLDLQGLCLLLGPHAAKGEPRAASDSSGTSSSQPTTASSKNSSALSTATGLSPIASSSRNTTLDLSGVKRAREDAAPPDAGGFFCRWQGCENSYDSRNALLNHIVNDHKPPTKTEAGKRKIPCVFHCRWVGCKNKRGNGYADWTVLKKHVKSAHLGMRHKKKTGQ